jgi:hypothetical protein
MEFLQVRGLYGALCTRKPVGGKGGNKAEQKIYVKNKEKNDRARRIEKKMKL